MSAPVTGLLGRPGHRRLAGGANQRAEWRVVGGGGHRCCDLARVAGNVDRYLPPMVAAVIVVCVVARAVEERRATRHGVRDGAAEAEDG